ncbi:MAG: glutamate synthase subunit beta [Eubacterium sp.]|nr:glutamate synthase subunit beta [Eubacterium sp.]
MWLKDNTLFPVVENVNKDAKRTQPDLKSVDERVSSFEQIESTYTKEQAENEMARCLKCPTHWCQEKCPAKVPVTDFIAAARSGDLEGAYELIRTASMMPEFCSRVCPQEMQCQSNCTRSIRSDAVGIGKLERYVVESHYASGKGEKTAPSTGKKVAVIGSGPSGLSCAQRLIDKGHSVTIFERADRAGGLLEYGIPNMKLEKGIVERKIDSLKAQGAEIKCGVNVGVDITAEDLEKSFDAVCFALGSRNARNLALENSAGVSGIVFAVDFLTENTKALLSGEKALTAKDKKVIIVGGGDTGNDCVGTSLRQGAESIMQIEMLPKERGHKFIFERPPYKEPEKKHDFSQEECAEKFGDPHVYRTTVKAVHAGDDAKVHAITTVDLEAVYDEHFRLQMKEIPGTEKEVPCDLLIIAAGFSGAESYVPEKFSLKMGERNTIEAPQYNAGGKYFACGDCRTGQSLVVKAMVDGRECADAVDAFLTK